MHDLYDAPASSRRPWLSPLKLVFFAILLFLGLGTWFLYTVITAKPMVSVDYGVKAHQLVRERQNMPEDAVNQWDLLGKLADKHTAAREAVVARHPEWTISTFDFSPIYSPDTRLSDEVSPQSATAASIEWIAEFRAQDGLADLARLTKVPYAARPAQDGAFLNVLLPELGQSRSIARMNAARMKLAADAGDQPERLAAFEESLAIARLLGAQQTLIDHLVAIAIDAVACGELRKELIENPPSGPDAKNLLDALDRQPLPPIGPVFDTERFFALDTIQRTFSDTGGGNGRYLPSAAAELGLDMSFGAPAVSSGGTPRAFNVIGLVVPDRAETEAKANEIYDYFRKAASMTRAERAAANIPDPSIGIERYRILEMMIPAFGKALQSRDQIDADLNATRLNLALEIHRATHGAYPAALAELSPSVLVSIPLDATNGKPFGYRVHDAAADPDGRGFLLYSIGTDGIDNGGSMGPKPEAIVTPFQAIGGTDFIYNQPRALPKDPDAAPEPTQPTAAEEARDQKFEIAPPAPPAPSGQN